MLRGGSQGRNEVGNIRRGNRERQGAVGRPTRRNGKQIERCHHVLLGEGEDILVDELEPFPLVGERKRGNIGSERKLKGAGRNHVDNETEDLEALGSNLPRLVTPKRQSTKGGHPGKDGTVWFTVCWV